MRLYIKQRVFSIGDTYNVYDEWGNEFFYVKSELFSFLAKIHLCDNTGKEVFLIKRKMSFWGAQYEVYSGEILCAVINQKVRFLRSELNISSQYGDFVVDGDFFSHNFRIYNNNSLIGEVRKAYLSWGDSYELDICSGADPAFFTALVIAIDNCMHNED